MDEVSFGRYRLVELIGEGGMGQVFKAHDTVIGRDVAVKVLPPEMSTLAGYRERFRREAQVAARLTEPHIIPIHDTGEIDGRLYLVMPIIEGIDVQTVLERDGPMTPPRAVHVIRQLAAALNVAHRNGLVHRDIKPTNALMTPDDHVYLIDFGIAHDASATRMTQTGMMVGTFSYMAPERFLAGTVDARADVYALTCVLHECLTGARPFDGDSMEQQIAGHLTGAPPKPSTIDPAIPAAFDEVIARGMAKQPAERYQTATELATAAHNALNSAPPPRPPRPPRDPAATHIDERRPPPPPRPRPPAPVTPVGPTIPAPPATQPAALLEAPAPEAPAVGSGEFACVVIGVVLVALAAAGFLAAPGHWYYLVHYLEFGSTLDWLLILGTISGIALLVLGRGRRHADRTITGSALVALGLGTMIGVLGISLPQGVAFIAAIVGLALVISPLYARPNRDLAGASLLCGAGILALALVELLALTRITLYTPLPPGPGGLVTGVILVVAAGIAWRRAPAHPPGASPDVSAGRLTAILSGVAFVGISITLSVVPWGYWAQGYSGGSAIVCWLIIGAAIAGIVLLALGRGPRHADRTIAGCALVVVGLSTIYFRLINYFETFSSFGAAFPGIVGVLLVLIPVCSRPTRALARGCVLVGSFVLVLTVVALILRVAHQGYISWIDLGCGVAIGLILLVGGGITWRRARRNAQGKAQLPAAAAGS